VHLEIQIGRRTQRRWVSARSLLQEAERVELAVVLGDLTNGNEQ
jgi:hypothetical protein